LVVDDAPAVRTRLVAMLRDIDGVEVREAGDVDQAMAQAREVEIVVLDVHLPGRSGLEAVPLLRKLEPRPMIIVLTNDATPPHKSHALALGADHFLDKSREFERVVDLVVAASS
jgi:DNA-binding NarL/FixJ family response regulator